MKLKAVISDDLEGVSRSFDTMRGMVLETVLIPHLHVPKEFGPAEFYVQFCDSADFATHGSFVEARLTGVSRTGNRADNDFIRAREALEKCYAQLIKKLVTKGCKVQLFVSIMLDQPLPGKTSALIEGDAVWIEGQKKSGG